MSGPRLIIALDYAEATAARAFVDRVQPTQCRLKIGLELFTAAGPAFVAELTRRGFDVFLDLKFHDIPNTVAAACARTADLGVWMLNVHTLGGRRMLDAARSAVDKASHRPLLVGVTLLTSHEHADVAELGLTDPLVTQTERLAAMAADSGLDGVVCSPLEAGSLRRQLGGSFILVTPGIRPAGSTHDDQRRILAPADAVAQGADYLVVGRPVTRAADPAAVLTELANEVAAAEHRQLQGITR